jgi:hypothetical protein
MICSSIDSPDGAAERRLLRVFLGDGSIGSL